MYFNTPQPVPASGTPSGGNVAEMVRGPEERVVGNATVFYHSNLEAASRAAQQQLVISGGTIVNGVLFDQGDRPMVLGTLPFNFVSSMLSSNSAKNVATIEEVQDKSNRPKDEKHTEAIVNYLAETVPNGVFILPGLTANVMAKTKIHTVRIDGDDQPPSRYAFVHLPMKPVLTITDGQHRQAALTQILEKVKDDTAAVERLNRSSIPIMITLSADIRQIHQDFADCSKGRQMSKSLLAVYDRRHPANGLVMDLVEYCGIFKDKTDSTNVKLGKNSPGLFLANMVRQAVKTFLTGGYGIGDEDFEDKAKSLFRNSATPEYLAASAFMVAYLNRATAAIPKLQEYADLTPEQVQARFAELRSAGFLFFTNTGLAILARIGWAIRKDGAQGWEPAIDKLDSVDWHRGTNQAWSDLGVATATRVSTGHRAIIKGAAYVAQQIGLDLPSLAANEDKDAAGDGAADEPLSDGQADVAGTVTLAAAPAGAPVAAHADVPATVTVIR